MWASLLLGESSCHSAAIVEKRWKETRRGPEIYVGNHIDLLMGLFRGAVFDHGPWWGARKLPISVNGAFPLLNGPFSLLNGPFPRMP